MGRVLTTREKRQLKILGVSPESLTGPSPSSPFGSGENNVKLYRKSDLRAREVRRTQRTEFFKRALQDLASINGGSVPYAFRISDRSLRTLDAACLAYLSKGKKPEIKFELDKRGYIAAVKLTEYGKRSTPTYVLEDLIAAAQQPVFQRLIYEARQGGWVTYGQLAEQVRVALSLPTASHHHMGHVVGALMERILKRHPDAPLINLLVVRGDSERAGVGADQFVEARYGRLTATYFESRVERERVRARGFGARWDDVYRELFGSAVTTSDFVQNQYDEDGKGDNPAYPAGRGSGESADHKALKQYVADHPECLRLRLRRPETTIESSLLSGDKMDVEIVDGVRRIGVEVKSWRSGYLDVRRGVFQCVKYREVMKAQYGLEDKTVACSSVLVLEQDPPADLKGVAAKLGVPIVVVSRPDD